MNNDPPTIETARLILRPPIQSDFVSWSALMADKHAARFIGGPQPASIAWRGMATMAGSWALKEFGMFSVIERETGRWIGRVGPWQPEGWPGPEIGYGLIQDACWRFRRTSGRRKGGVGSVPIGYEGWRDGLNDDGSCECDEILPGD